MPFGTATVVTTSGDYHRDYQLALSQAMTAHQEEFDVDAIMGDITPSERLTSRMSSGMTATTGDKHDDHYSPIPAEVDWDAFEARVEKALNDSGDPFALINNVRISVMLDLSRPKRG